MITLKSGCFHKAIRGFITILLILSLFFGLPYMNYAIVLALIYIMNRVPLEYAKPKKKK